MRKNGVPYGVPFVSGSGTSEAAAVSMFEKAQTDALRVFRFVQSRGPGGATDYEIEQALGMLHQNASARRNGLVKEGYVCDSGSTRQTGSGRQATVWVCGAGGEVVGPENDRCVRPTKTQIAEALGTIRQLLDFVRPLGGPKLTESLRVVGTWLRWIERH